MPKAFRWLVLLPFVSLTAKYFLEYINSEFYNSGFYNNWFVDFGFYNKILFTIILIFQLRSVKLKITETNSSKNHYLLIKLFWAKFFIYFNIILNSFLLMYLFLTIANGRLFEISSPYFIYSQGNYNFIYALVNAFFIFIFGYLALRNQSVFNNPVSTRNLIEQSIVEFVLPIEEKKFQAKIEFPDEQKQKMTLLLEKLLEKDKVYLDPELSLSKLSVLSSIPQRQLSQFIQAYSGKNYKEFINSYRVKHAQQMLGENNNKRYTMYSVAFDSGFNSESSFYKIFKDQTGLTPKQYQDKF